MDELVNWANIANDESDFGASLQLAADLFNHAPLFARQACALYRTAYTLLGRDAFAAIADAHAPARHRT